MLATTVLTRELLECLTTIQRYLMQQENLFGDTLYQDERSSPKKGHTQDRRSTGRGENILPDEPWARTEDLDGLHKQIGNCLACALGHTRLHFVFGVGNPRAEVMFIGEAPGADEDAQGEPFVGRAGQLLNQIIEAVGMKREEVYICNILKCRPPNNRDPESSEMECCTPYLMKQIELLRPKFIICLGRISAQWLLQTTESLSGLRGRAHDFRGSKLIVTYHPAALLRNPGWKRPAWEDMKMFRRLYDEMKGTP